ncbi:MAG: hypothetical protein IJ604_01120 [Prevotella sp.]|nr:hypothetical protein [Prevotella sp.]
MSEISFNEQKPEVPVIIIERDDDEQQKGVSGVKPLSRRARWLRRLLMLATILAVAVGVLAAYHLWRYYYHIGVPVSTTPSENIAKLKAPIVNETPEVVMTSDDVLGVALDFYAIHGLQASLSFEEPDTADASVFLYCRSADHKPDETYLGSLVVEGEELEADRSRLGYMAMADGRMVIGVSRSEKVKDYVAGRGGSFFRQFILVSDGVIPSRFYLHGKVERRAIGRIDDTLYFIATRNKETLWDFADALREYGFIDAIYITGGTDYCFYRSADGRLHDIGDVADYPHTKWQGVIPWLVFRKMD